MKRLFLLGFMMCITSVLGQDLLGPVTVDQLKEAPFDTWFIPEYENYTPFSKTIDQLSKKQKGVEVVVFMGTWCSDSRMQVPAFFRILDMLDLMGKTSIIAVDEDKQTPSGSATANNITHVPTFIFYKNGKEINRIVESPIEFLEDDMLAILSEVEYKHTYEN